MKVVALCGSPREKGNTQFYLETILEELKGFDIETELVFLKNYKIGYCTGCYACLEKKNCVQQDDFEEIFQKVHAADGILIGSPVYVARTTSLLSAFLERATFAGRASGRLLSGKVGAPVTVARRAGHTLAFSELLLWYFINDMVIPGSMYWNVGVAGAKGAKDAANDLEGIAIVKHFAGNMARVMKALCDNAESVNIDTNKLFCTPQTTKTD